MFGWRGTKQTDWQPRIRHFDQLGPEAEDVMVHMIETNALPSGHKGVWAAPFLADLVFLLADAEGFVTCERLDALGQSGPHALQDALGRFAEAGHRTKMGPAAGHPAMFMVEVADDPSLTPMLLAMPQLFNEVLRATGGGAIFITHPVEDRIFAAPCALEGAEQLMLETLEQEADGALRQSDYVFRLEARGRLTPYLFVPAGGAPQRVDEEFDA
ncbi:MAG: hypothetical protein AAF340_18130 [Pseudomonadota bacterium]